jgi:serine/threonine protein kinase
MIDRTGEQIGSYRLTKLLGSGGFAHVYLGRHVYLDSPAAIKVIYMNITQEDWENFRAEARTLARLLHPHIIRLLDFGLDGQIPYLVMDYAPYGTIRQCVPPGKRLPLATVVEYTNQLASALQYAHDQKVIHRDIKPENILLGPNNELLLTDFGIAVVVQGTSTHVTQETAGTIAYIAPEQLQSHARPASDQYSLGVMVYEWLTGKRPFTGAFAELALKHIKTPPPPLHETLPDIPPEVEQVVLTALAKDPKQRFESTQAFATALEQAVKTAQALANQETVLSAQPLQQPIIVASPATSIPPLLSRVDPASSPAGFQASQPIKLANALTRLDMPPDRGLPSEEAARVALLTTPQALPQLPVTPQPILAEPASARRGISRRVLLFGGLAAAGLVAASGTTLLALHHHLTTGGQGPGSTTPTATSTTVVPAYLAQDTFQRADQQFWGIASDGQTWEQDAATSPDFSIVGQTGKIYRRAQRGFLYTAILGPTITDADVIVTSSISQFNNPQFGNSQVGGALLRWIDNDRYYKAYIDGSKLYILKRPAPNPNASPVLASVDFRAQTNTLYTLRFRAIGRTLQAKVWQTGSPEPTNWMVSAHDTLLASGRAGLRPQVNQYVTLQVTSFTLNKVN